MNLETMSLLPRSVRLLLVADSLNVGGAERHVVNLASALAQQGYSVTLACSVDGALAPLAVQAGVTVRPLLHYEVKRRLSPTFAWKLAKLLRQGQFDLVHAHMYASAVASALARLGTGIPLVITEHSEASWRTQAARLCSRWVYRYAKHVIAVSKGIRRRLIEQDGVPFDRVSVIMNALSTEPGAQPDLPAELCKRPLVGIAARLRPEKGVAYFLEAAVHVLQVLPEANFLVMGDGPLRKELQTYAQSLGVQERVHFLGFRLDARALVGLLDMLVVPSLSEGTPLVTLEAMSAGVPVVATAVGGIPEQIRHNSEGLLVPPGDAMALADAILHLLQNRPWARRLGEAGRRKCSTHFSFATMLQKTEAVYYAALGWQAEDSTHDGEISKSFTEIGR